MTKKTLTVNKVALPVSEDLKVKARVRAGRRIPRGGIKLVICGVR